MASAPATTLQSLSDPTVERPVDMALDDAAMQRALRLARETDWSRRLPHGMDAPFYQAGLAGYSDAAMRIVAREHGCDYCITEAMLDKFLIAGGKGLDAARLDLLGDDPIDRPIAGQLMGSHPQDIAQGAAILVELGYDVIDVNLACPVKKIKKKCRGGHLLQEPGEAIAILQAVREAVPDATPTSVKLRRGSDDSPQADANFDQIFQAAIDLGYTSATVHCRTVEQKYHGPGRWGFLRALAERAAPYRKHLMNDSHEGIAQAGATTRPSEAVSCAVPDEKKSTSLPGGPDPLVAPHRVPARRTFYLFGSGDIWDAIDIFRMIEQTGVDGVSVARGCIGNPWLFTQARAIVAGDLIAATTPPTIQQQRDVLLRHFELSVALHGESPAGRMMRKFGIKFSKHHPQSDAVRDAFITVKSLDDWRAVLAEHYV